MKYIAKRGFFFEGAWVDAGDALRLNEARAEAYIRSGAVAKLGKAEPHSPDDASTATDATGATIATSEPAKTQRPKAGRGRAKAGEEQPPAEPGSEDVLAEPESEGTPAEPGDDAP